MNTLKSSSNTEKHDFVQVLNPRSKRYVKTDRTIGVIVSSKQTPGPYKGVRIVSEPK